MRLRFWHHESDEPASRTDALKAIREIRRTNKRNQPSGRNASDSPNDLWWAGQMLGDGGGGFHI